jgi:hypothetical protein
MRHLTVLLATAVVASLGCGLGVAVADPTPPPGATVVEVTGDDDNGFGILHYDGSEEFPPTWSEARAECGEYDTQVDRVRCRAEVRTWYDDLAVLQQALAWAHAS